MLFARRACGGTIRSCSGRRSRPSTSASTTTRPRTRSRSTSRRSPSRIYARLVPHVGWAAERDATEIVLTDQTDSANGSATALPVRRHHPLRHRARRHVAARRRRRLVPRARHARVHAHPAHRSHPGHPGAHQPHPRQDVAPNQVQPHWILEGLAVFEESTETSGGRLRSSMWNMWMRADVLEDNVATLDQFSNIPRRWPQGNIWYLYGSFFMQWIAETYGEQAIRAMIDDYSSQIIPYAINRSIRRATGSTFEELYVVVGRLDAARLRRRGGRHPRARAARGRARSRTRATRTSTRGGSRRTRGPTTRATCSTTSDDGHTTAGQWALPLRARRARARGRGARGPDRELHHPHQRRRRHVVHARRHGGLQLGRTSSHNLFFFDDLFELPAHERSPRGLDGNARPVERRLARARSRACRPTAGASSSRRTTAGRRT